ncbi:AAA domain containing protein [uncultured Caudovirales phage]|uniref:AAA domain containing protein n=1 Tax=uncultured Caudovirales phage TaxID=2100421 RepID=A0A6J5M716_9CAUD|nr:AAA domain containing protein [uncultured Caudovirales phage]
MAIKITSPADVREGMHSVLYGKPKTGKTSTCDDPNFKVLIADLEGGTAVLSDAKNVDRVAIESFEQFREFTEMVQRGFVEKEGDFNYDLVVIDSISRLQELVKEYVAKAYAPNRKREIQGKFGAMADWGDLRDIMLSAVKAWHSTTKRGEKSFHVMWIAHEGVVKDDLTEQAIATKIQLQGKDTADIVMAHVDAIFYMYNKLDEEGNIKRGILTKNYGIFQAGVRQSKHRDPLPTAIENPVWSDIYEQLGYIRK